MIRLSQSDWVEVFHALKSKLEECELWLDGSPESDKSVRMWIEKLKGIQANIGPDGRIALRRGVAPDGGGGLI